MRGQMSIRYGRRRVNAICFAIDQASEAMPQALIISAESHLYIYLQGRQLSCCYL